MTEHESAIPAGDHQTLQDAEHLRVLAIAWKVTACLFGTLLVVVFLPIVISMLHAMNADVSSNGGELFVSSLVGLMLVVGMLFVASAWILALDLERHRNHNRCLVIAVFACFAPPIGLVLGLITLAVLSRLSVKQVFV